MFEVEFSRPLRRVLLLAACACSAASLTAQPASSRPERWPVAKSTDRAKAAAAPRAKAATPKAATPGPLLTVIAIAEQRISVYGREGLLARSAVSTGMAGHRTPTGVFSVIGKERWHRSNIYSGAPMPLMQRITWSGVALHAGVLPGYPASHGCIRLHHSFAQQLWGMTRIGTRVVVAPHDTAPEAISHPQLPRPALLPPPEMNVASSGGPLVAVALASSDASPKLLNPHEWALAAKTKASADHAASVKAAKTALEHSIAVSTEARRALAELRAAEAELSSARAAVQAAEKASTGARLASPAPAREAAEQRLAGAGRRAEEARAAESAKRKEAFAAAETSKQADRVSEAAAELVQDIVRRAEPLSIFISRTEGRLFVRQGFKPVFDAPVTVKDPGRPLGTHTFLATEPASGEAGLRWIALSVPTGAGPEPRSATSPGRPARREPVAAHATHRVTAAAALGRIEIAPDVAQRLAERLWVGASLVVSDYSVSSETGEYTDFIVLTH